MQNLSNALERVICLILLYPRGLSILLGAAPPPSALELILYFPPKSFDSLGIHCSQRPYEERVTEAAGWADEVIALAGGWVHITRCTLMWRAEHLDTWNMVAEHIRNVRPRQRWLEGSALAIVARKYCVSPRYVTRRRNALPGLLADCVLHTPKFCP
jgi:hypothetical protein